eukprot:1147227-Pelagomonas_calceolata.AAC.4
MQDRSQSAAAIQQQQQILLAQMMGGTGRMLPLPYLTTQVCILCMCHCPSVPCVLCIAPSFRSYIAYFGGGALRVNTHVRRTSLPQQVQACFFAGTFCSGPLSVSAILVWLCGAALCAVSKGFCMHLCLIIICAILLHWKVQDGVEN